MYSRQAESENSEINLSPDIVSQFHVAAYTGSIENAEKIKAKIGESAFQQLCLTRNSKGSSALAYTVAGNQGAFAEWLLGNMDPATQQAALNFRTKKYQESVIHLAASYGSIEVVKQIRKADEDKFKELSQMPLLDGQRPVTMAMSRNRAAFLEWLLESMGPSARQEELDLQCGPENWNLIHFAALYGSIEAAEVIKKSYPEMFDRLCQSPDRKGYLPIAIAMWRGHPTFAIWLLEAANERVRRTMLTWRFPDRKNLFDLAAQFGVLEVAKKARSYIISLQEIKGYFNEALFDIAYNKGDMQFANWVIDEMSYDLRKTKIGKIINILASKETDVDAHKKAWLFLILLFGAGKDNMFGKFDYRVVKLIRPFINDCFFMLSEPRQTSYLGLFSIKVTSRILDELVPCDLRQSFFACFEGVEDAINKPEWKVVFDVMAKREMNKLDPLFDADKPVEGAFTRYKHVKLQMEVTHLMLPLLIEKVSEAGLMVEERAIVNRTFEVLKSLPIMNAVTLFQLPEKLVQYSEVVATELIEAERALRQRLKAGSQSFFEPIPKRRLEGASANSEPASKRLKGG